MLVPFGSQNHPKARPKRLKSAPRGDPKRFLAVSGGLLGRSWGAPGRPWAALERSGPSWGYPRAYLGPIFEEFGMDFEVRTATEEDIHNEP